MLHGAQLKLETREIQDQKFSDICNILYITNFGIDFNENIEFQRDWCLSLKTEASDFIYIKSFFSSINSSI